MAEAPADVDDVCFRSVFSRHVNMYGAIGRERPSSEGFADRDGEPSVYLRSVLMRLGLRPQAILEHRKGEEVWSVQVRAVRDLGMDVDPRPILDTEVPIDPAHAVILMPPTWSASQRKRGRKSLASIADKVC